MYQGRDSVLRRAEPQGEYLFREAVRGQIHPVPDRRRRTVRRIAREGQRAGSQDNDNPSAAGSQEKDSAPDRKGITISTGVLNNE